MLNTQQIPVITPWKDRSARRWFTALFHLLPHPGIMPKFVDISLILKKSAPGIFSFILLSVKVLGLN